MNFRNTLLTALIALILGLGGTTFTAGAAEMDSRDGDLDENVQQTAAWDDDDAEDDWEDEFEDDFDWDDDDDDWEDDFDEGDDDW